MNKTDTEKQLKQLILDKVFLRFKDDGADRWIFDFRRVSMTDEFMDLYAALFFLTFPEKKVQVCGLESASIPLVSALVAKGHKHGVHVTGLFIRKSRKKHDLYRALEGVPTDAPLVLVDDIVNTGKSTEKLFAVLKEEGLSPHAVFTLMRFRDKSFYNFLTSTAVSFHAVFELNDFSDALGLKNMESPLTLKPLSYEHLWGFKANTTTINYRNVVPKSAPVLIESKLYFGTDSGSFYCLDAKTGHVIWEHKTLFGDGGKRIYSTPVVANGVVYFGAYDGNLYALDAETGRKKWICMEADWIGSSPAYSEKHKLIYVGLEFGLWKKRGGIIALNAATGDEVWRDVHGGLTHCSPFASDKNNLLLCGSNDGVVRIYNALTGKKLKELAIGEPVRASFSENASGTRIAFGAFDRKCHIIDVKTLEIVDSFETYEAIYSTPLWIGENLIVSSLDKRLYSYDTARNVINWKFLTRGRVFCSPMLWGHTIMIGSNDGILYKIDAETGKELGHIQFPERIVNRIAQDTDSGNLIVPLFTDELRCIQLM